jgi:hypothetical protein
MRTHEYPWLRFPASWEVRITPPAPLAAIRFQVRKRGGERWISVYLDTEDKLGSVGQPYWELYPYCNGGTRRFLVGEEEALLRALRYALRSGGIEP